MITATVSGTYRHRLRVKFLWFWIVKPWKTDSFSYSFPFDPSGQATTVRLPGLPISLTARIQTSVLSKQDNVVLEANVEGVDVQIASVPININVVFPFQAEPIKGCIFQGNAGIYTSATPELAPVSVSIAGMPTTIPPAQPVPSLKLALG